MSWDRTKSRGVGQPQSWRRKGGPAPHGSAEKMESSGAWKRSAVIYCGLVFVVSWSLWIAAGRSGDATTEVSFLFLHLDLSQKSVLVMLGNVVPGIVAVIMKLLDDERPLRGFLVRLGSPK